VLGELLFRGSAAERGDSAVARGRRAAAVLRALCILRMLRSQNPRAGGTRHPVEMPLW